ncbi:hypothetical protein JS528_11160 [Bifidobacterium sp. MA2]|uniref:Uncharacterized protein n=1 Tax=Bifidobacterium santillanense TaxID=2809028 RepID=A0ABS5UTQ0_9BIFI|nr:hypothetical protein [Bifidobacterium santillanense]MBT1173878.1 hypothetical protein [Bifidobacterium santillanense]
MHTKRTLMTWPLTPEGLSMQPGELMASLYETINLANADPAWPYLIIPPKPGEIEIDRRKGWIGAECEYVSKRELRKEHRND